jgi:FixJ family two-component response regulator
MYQLSNSSAAVRLPPIDMLRVPVRRVDARPSAPLLPVVLVAEGDKSGRHVLEGASHDTGWQLGALSSAGALLSRLPDLVPTCLVLDLTSLEQDGIQLLLRLAAERPETPVVCVTGATDISMTVRAMKAGAVDVLAKPVRAEALVGAIREALNRSAAVLQQKKAMSALQDRYASLSRREQEVMALVVAGLLNKQVGGELGISVITVKAHRGKVMRKMQARSLADLVKMSAQLEHSPISERH